MRKLLITVMATALAIGVAAVPVFAEDSPADAAKIVKLVPAASGHQHPDYYTAKHGFMNDDDLQADNGGPLEKGMYLMSWLVLDPPIVLAGGGGAASISKDLLKEYVGVPEESISRKNPKNWPIAGQKAKKVSEGIGKDGMWWIPINFQDLQDAGQGSSNSGNQFDWAEWGGQGLNQFHEYLFTLAKWDKGGSVSFAAGSDDPEQTWVDGVKTTEGLADRNWTADTDLGDATVPAGEWIPILAEVGENGGECGYTLRVDPPPDDVTLNIELALAVDARGRATTTWGRLKAGR